MHATTFWLCNSGHSAGALCLCSQIGLAVPLDPSEECQNSAGRHINTHQKWLQTTTSLTRGRMAQAWRTEPPTMASTPFHLGKILLLASSASKAWSLPGCGNSHSYHLIPVRMHIPQRLHDEILTPCASGREAWTLIQSCKLSGHRARSLVST